MANYYVMPQELKAPTKVSKFLYLSDLLFCIAYFMIFKIFDVFVDERLKMLYYIFNIVMAVILTAPSIYNPPKRVYQSLIYMLAKDRAVYHPITPPETHIIKGDIIGKTVEIEKNYYQQITENPRN